MTGLVDVKRQPAYEKGYQAYLDGMHKNPFEYMTERMRSHKIYWQMGYEQAEKDDKPVKTNR